MNEQFETQAEREERLAALSGVEVRETAPEDIDAEDHVPCGCGNRLTCGECMRMDY